MIRIVKPGTKIEQKWNGTCPACRCEVECDKGDLKKTILGAYFLDCPYCMRSYIEMSPMEAAKEKEQPPVPPKCGSGTRPKNWRGNER